MLKVGLTGGYASGKSHVARHLASLGCHVIYADKLGHQVLLPGGEAYAPAVSLFGTGILGTDQTIDRKKLASIVFQSPELLKQLNAIVHPAVFRLEAQSFIGFESQNPKGIAVIEAAILIETGRYKTLDRLMVTSCPAEVQIQRAMARDQITRQEAESRLARQISDAERIRFADYVVYTDGPPEQTIAQVDSIYNQLRQLSEES
jgi:dephospho-CoA kinase